MWFDNWWPNVFVVVIFWEAAWPCWPMVAWRRWQTNSSRRTRLETSWTPILPPPTPLARETARRETTPTVTTALCNKGWHFWKGGFVTDKTGLKIFVFINAMIFAFTTFVKNTPLYGKIASKVWKIYFQYISPHFLDAAGGQISYLWLLLLSNSSLFFCLNVTPPIALAA